MAFGFGSAIDQMVVAVVADVSDFERGIQRATKGVTKFDRDISGATGGVSRMSSALTGLGRAFVGFASVAVIARDLTQVSKAAAQFQTGMAEIKTLLDDTSQFDRLEDAVTDLSKAFGKDVTDQIGALYSIVSAGATDAGRATEILTAANRLALAGVTDVATAADGLTTILNAFGTAAGSAEGAANAVFLAMRSGKTTVGELAQNISTVASTAVGLGVSLQDVLAATSALAAGGVKTNVAMTGLRAIINAIVNPSTEAAKAFKALGIATGAIGLREAGGLSGFLKLVTERTGGAADAIAKLFPPMEALGPALALTGAQAGLLAENMRKLEGGADSLSAGVAIMQDTTEEAFKRLGQAFAASRREIGRSLNESLAPIAAGLADNFDDITLAVQSLTKALAYGAGAWVAYKVAVTAFAVRGTIVAFVQLAASVRSVTSAVALATAATVGLRAALAFLLSPIAIAVTVIGTLATAFFLVGKRAKEAAEASARAVADFQIALDAMEMRGLKTELRQVTREWELAGAQIELANRSLKSAREFALKSPSVGAFHAVAAAEKRVTDAVNAQTAARQKMLQVVDELAERVPLIEPPSLDVEPPKGITDAVDSFKLLKDQIDATFVRLDFFQSKLAAVGARGEAGGIVGDMVGGQIFTEVRRLEDALSDVRRQIELQGGAHQANVDLLTQELRIVERLAGLTPQVDMTPIRLPAVATDAFDNKRIQAAADATRDLASQFQAATIAGRGLIQIADSMGKLDDETRRTLEGVLGLVDAFGSFKEAARQAAESVRLVKAAADLARGGDAAGAAAASAGASAANAAAMVAKASAIIAAIGAFVSIVSTIFAKTQAQIEREQILKKNNESLDRLRLTMEGFLITISSTLGAGGALTQVLSTEIGRILTELSQVSILGIGAQALTEFNKMLVASGTSLRELQAFASANGIEILDSKGRLVAGAMDQLVEALALAAQEAATFSKSVADQATLMEARVAIFGLDTDPLAEAQRAFDFMGQNLSPAIGALFNAIDVSTAEGRQAAKELVQRIFEDIEAGTAGAFGLDPALLGNFETIEQFLQFILNADNALDAFADSADTAADAMKQTTDALRNVPAGFKVALARFGATSPDSTVFPFGSNVITDPGFLPPGGAGGGVLIAGDVYIDARTKPVDVALAELTAEARRTKNARTGTTADPFDIP